MFFLHIWQKNIGHLFYRWRLFSLNFFYKQIFSDLYLPVQLLKNYIGSGVIGPFPECKDKVSNHAMVAVGFGEQFGMKYWLLKNSWGIE